MRWIYRGGEVIGGWRLARRLGRGGNGEVWQATSSGDPAAVKFLRSRDINSERYQRFQAEVRVHQETAGNAGVLPMLDHELPANPSKHSPAWLSMPLAVRVEKALGPNPRLERVVGAIVEVAETLASLQQRGVAHRDIKPTNLLAWKGRWVLGDLGLATFPGKAALTRTGHQLGPLHFMAPEMFIDAKGADPYKADAFSLAQTMFVLATGQRYPPRGGVRLAEPHASLSAWINVPRMGSLDALLELATALAPGARPTHSEFAAELRAWLRGPAPPLRPLDLSDLRADAIALVARETGEAKRFERLRDAAHRLARDVDEQATKVTSEIGSALPGFVRGEDANFAAIVTEGGSRSFGAAFVHVGEVVSYVAPASSAYGLWSGFTFNMRRTGELLIGAGHVIGQGSYLGLTLRSGPQLEVHVVWKASQVVRAGTAEAEQIAAALVKGFAEHARKAVQELLERLQGRST